MDHPIRVIRCLWLWVLDDVRSKYYWHNLYYWWFIYYWCKCVNVSVVNTYVKYKCNRCKYCLYKYGNGQCFGSNIVTRWKCVPNSFTCLSNFVSTFHLNSLIFLLQRKDCLTGTHLPRWYDWILNRFDNGNIICNCCPLPIIWYSVRQAWSG